MPRRLTDQELERRRFEAERVHLVLDRMFGGNQTRLAEEIGASQSLVSKILRGERLPGRKFLEKLARLPGVNPEYVLSGIGQLVPPSMRGTLPVALGVLPGPPESHPDLLTGDRHPVPDAYDRQSRYWLRIADQSPLIQVTAWAILVGDLLLMESSPECTGRLDLVVGRLCGVRQERQSETVIVVGRVERDATRVVLTCGKVISKLEEPPPPPPPPTARPVDPENDPPVTRISIAKHLQRLREEREEQERRRQEEQAQLREQGVGTFTLQDIVAVCVYLVRPIPASASASIHRPDNG